MPGECFMAPSFPGNLLRETVDFANSGSAYLDQYLSSPLDLTSNF